MLSNIHLAYTLNGSLAQPILSYLLPRHGSKRLLSSRSVQAQDLSLDNAFRKAGGRQNFLCFQRMVVLTCRKSVVLFCSYPCKEDSFWDVLPLLKPRGDHSGGKLWPLYNHPQCTFPWGPRVLAVDCACIYKLCSWFFSFLGSMRYVICVTSQLSSMTARCPNSFKTWVTVRW